MTFRFETANERWKSFRSNKIANPVMEDDDAAEAQQYARFLEDVDRTVDQLKHNEIAPDQFVLAIRRAHQAYQNGWESSF